ncbi:MAG: hypothetical protein R3C49_01650 [Planctomycetaceae bacterium]
MTSSGRPSSPFVASLALALPFCLSQISRLDAADETAADRTSLAILAPGGPVVASLKISVDGQPYRLWVTTFLTRRIDLDNNGELSAEELALIPERLMAATGMGTATELLHKAAGSSDATTISQHDFSEWFAERLSRSFNIIAGAVKPAEAVRMAALIDQNSDGRINRSELMSARQWMRFRDLDDDQTFTAAELLPFRDPRNQLSSVVPDAADLPFVQLTDDQAIRRTVEQIRKRYGSGKTIDAAVLRLPDGADPSLTGEITADQLSSFLTNPVPHLTMDVLLSDRANASDLKITVADSATDFCSVTTPRRGRSLLKIDDMPIEIRPRGGSQTSRGFMVNFLLQRMVAYDEDKNGYLSAEEFPQLQQDLTGQLQVQGSFQDVDLNSDGMLLRDEVKAFIERDAIATQAHIDVSVRQDGQTLFKLLDINSDRRLSERELREGFDVLLKYDVSGDEQLSEAELGTEYALQIGLGQAPSLRLDSMAMMSMQARSTDAVLPGLSGLSGPEWFRRMDRNQDHDVSRREFLAPQNIFDQLDTNHDNLLSAEEASAL